VGRRRSPGLTTVSTSREQVPTPSGKSDQSDSTENWKSQAMGMSPLMSMGSTGAGLRKRPRSHSVTLATSGLEDSGLEVPGRDVAPDGVSAAALEVARRAMDPAADIFDGFAGVVGFCGASAEGKRRPAAVIDEDFGEKAVVVPPGVDSDGLRRQIAAEGVAAVCRKGKKPMQPNQDNYFVAQTERFRVICVADGHGEHGHWVSHWAARACLRLFLQSVSSSEALPADEVVSRHFHTVHEAIKGKAAEERLGVDLSGTTLSVVVLERGTLQAMVATVGDSRCVVGRQGAKGAEVVVSTRDHKPQDPDERRRIVGNGGEVVRIHDDMPHRVFVRGMNAPGLAMSRALGDLLAHSVGVSHVPSVTRFAMEAGQMLLLCSDGVWEFIKNAEAVKMAFPLGPARAFEAAAALAAESRSRWLKEEGAVTDDITAVVLWA